MRRTFLGLVLVVSAAGCTWQADLATSGAVTAPLQVVPTPQEYDRVRSGDVQALVPPGWDAIATSADDVRQGIVASPRLGSSGALRRGTTGLSATWIDATSVGVPSDYYYLAAKGPALSRLVASERCTALSERVYVNNAPSFAMGRRSSPGDFIARGEGVCRGREDPSTRWAYFVAAPGLGPARRIGIPTSGLYVVVALAPAGPKASVLLDHLLQHTRFGDASTGDFIRAVRAVPAT